jgi:MFS family permease
MAEEDVREKYWSSHYPVIQGLFYAFQGLYLTALMMYTTVFMTEIWELPYGTMAFINMMMMMPGYLKSFTGLLSDRVPWGRLGRRRPYIMVGSLAFIPTFLVLGRITEYCWTWIAALILITWCWVLVDGTLDALTVDVTPPRHMGLMQGIAWGCRGAGAAVGSIVAALVARTYGWTITIYVIGLMAFLMGVSALFIREPSVTKEKLPGMKAFKDVFSQKTTWLGFLFTIIFLAGISSFLFAGPFLMRDIGLTTDELGIAMAVIQIGSFFGSMLFGKASDKFGAKKTVYLISPLFWVSVALWFTLAPGMWWWILAVAAIYGFFYGGYNSPALRVIMELSPPALGGFMFATYCSTANIGMAVVGNMTLGYFVPYLGMPTAALTLIPYTILGALILRFMKVWEPKVKSS